jgi:8-oxo-dGTP pyrophosphatase MutT (NUDIX family)
MEESGGHGADASRLRLRRAGRVIVLDLDGRVLLFRYDDVPPNGRHWCTPGGGLDDGEDYAAGARRELAEETGWTDVVLGDEVAAMHVSDGIAAWHWWTLAEMDATDEVIWPAGLADLIRGLTG